MSLHIQVTTWYSWQSHGYSFVFYVQSAEQRAATLAAEVDDQNIIRDREYAEMVEVGHHNVFLILPFTY